MKFLTRADVAFIGFLLGVFVVAFASEYRNEQRRLLANKGTYYAWLLEHEKECERCRAGDRNCQERRDTMKRYIAEGKKMGHPFR